MTNHEYFSFQERRCQVIMLSLLIRKMEFVIIGSNVNKWCFSIKLGYTKLTRLEMKQSELGCFIHRDGRKCK